MVENEEIEIKKAKYVTMAAELSTTIKALTDEFRVFINFSFYDICCLQFSSCNMWTFFFCTTIVFLFSNLLTPVVCLMSKRICNIHEIFDSIRNRNCWKRKVASPHFFNLFKQSWGLVGDIAFHCTTMNWRPQRWA